MYGTNLKKCGSENKQRRSLVMKPKRTEEEISDVKRVLEKVPLVLLFPEKNFANSFANKNYNLEDH